MGLLSNLGIVLAFVVGDPFIPAPMNQGRPVGFVDEVVAWGEQLHTASTMSLTPHYLSLVARSSLKASRRVSAVRLSLKRSWTLSWFASATLDVTKTRNMFRISPR